MDEAIKLLIDKGFLVVKVEGDQITVELPPVRELS